MPARPRALVALGVFWGAVIVVAGGGAALLQMLGPPAPKPEAAPPHVMATPAPPPRRPVAVPLPQPAVADGAVRAPDPALLEPQPGMAGVMLPRIAADGRTAQRVYAAPFDPADKRPRIALLIGGFGLSEGDSRAAIALPGSVTFAVSPYAVRPDTLLADARAHGHEYLVSIPMESQGYPLNDAGNRSLLTGADPAENAQNLGWVLGRVQGYVGATGALDGLRGERFAASVTAMGLVQAELSARGLLYVDARPGAPAPEGGRSVDVVVDEPATRGDIDAKLARLETMARERGSALGLAGPLRPVTLDRVANWAKGLDARGLALAPVSALLKPKDGT